MPAERLRAAGLAVRAGGGADDLAVDDQVDAGLAGEAAAADQEVEERPVDPERRAGQRAGRVVAADGS